MSDFRYLGTPEAVLAVPADVPAGYPIDAIECALSRADAVLLLLSGQFDGTGAERLNDHAIAAVLWAVRGELALLSKLIEHGDRTKRHAVEDLDMALAAAKPVAQRAGGAQ